MTNDHSLIISDLNRFPSMIPVLLCLTHMIRQLKEVSTEQMMSNLVLSVGHRGTDAMCLELM